MARGVSVQTDTHAVDLRSTPRALGLALAIATLPYWEVLTGRRSAMYGDVNDISVPQYTAVWRAITHGDWPWWTPGVFGGHSMVGAGQFAVFYPLNGIFGVLDPVPAYRWWLLAHVWIGAGGAFLWAWRRWGSRIGAVVTAVAYSGCGFAVFHHVHPPFTIAVAWAPFAFLGCDLVRERWSTGRAALVAVPLALVAFAGQPQLLWITLLGLGVYVVFEEAAAVFEGTGGGRQRRAQPQLARALRAGGAVVIGLGIAAVQLLPLWRFSRTSQRPSLSMEDAFDLDALPRHLLTAVFPWAFGGSSMGSAFSSPWRGGDIHHEVGMFVGATILTLAVFAVIRCRREPVVAGLLAMVLVSVVIGLGDHTPMGRVVYDVVPLARSFRAWARTMWLANLALAALAGLGVRELLLRQSEQRLREPAVRLGGAVLCLVVVALVLPHVGSFDDSLAEGADGVVALGLPVLCLLGLAVAVVLAARHPRAGAAAVVAVCAFEVIAFVYPAPWRGLSGPTADLEAYYDASTAPSFGRPHDAAGGVDRWVSNTYGLRMVSLVKAIAGVNGYDPLMQDEWSETAAGFVYDGYPSRSDFWEPGWEADVLRVTTLLANHDVVPTDPSWHRVRDVPELDLVRWEREPRLPEAYLVGAVTVGSLDSIRPALRDPSTPLDRMAFVEDRVRDEVLGLDRPGRSGRVLSADVLGLGRGGGRLEVDAERPSLLVLSHTWSDGWTATVDGQGVEVLRANGLVLGVAVPAGHHVVRLRYLPPGMVPGVAIAALAGFGLVGGAPLSAALLGWRRGRRRGWATAVAVSAGARQAAGRTRSGADPP